MKNTLFKLSALVMLIALAACGTFRIEGQVHTETSPTDVSIQSDQPAEPVSESTAVPGGRLSASPNIGLSEFVVILVLLVFVCLIAAVVIGIYMLVRDRTPSSGYPSIGDQEPKQKSLTRLLRFSPNGASVALSLSLWAGIIGIGTIASLVTLLLGDRAFPQQSWEPTLTQPSSILVGDSDPHMKFIPDSAACRLAPPSDERQQMQCAISLEGRPLTVDVELENGRSWYCSAQYDNQPVSCRASFDMLDHQTYIVINSDLGLTQSRFQQLVEETTRAGWSEQNWIWLARAVLFLLSLLLLVLLWRASGRQTDSAPAPLLRAVYSGGISLMFFGALSFISYALLLVLNLID